MEEPSGDLLDTCTGTKYGAVVTKTFRHRGLKRLYQNGDASKVRADQLKRIADVLAHLDVAVHPSDLDLPGYRMHALKGALKGYWSVRLAETGASFFVLRTVMHSISIWWTTTRKG